MKAAQVHRTLRQTLDAWFLERGFRRVRSAPLAYQRHAGGGCQTVWFQLDHWGWNALWGGSRFFVNFRVADAAEREAPYRREERLNFFLSDEDLVAARALHDEIVSRVPPPPQEAWRMFEEQARRLYPDGEAMVEALRANFEPAQRAFVRHHDFGLRYYGAEDVEAWGRFLLGVLPHATEAMAEWS